MKTLQVKDLIPGMVIGADVYDSSGNLLFRTGTTVNEAAITTLRSYYIYNVFVEDSSIPATAEIQESTRSEQVKNSKEFREFKVRFEDVVSNVQVQINDIVARNVNTLDTEALLSQPMSLFQGRSPQSVFDMLHNLRSYDDTTYVHCINVSLISGILARWAGYPEEDIETAILAGVLHDIGKLVIPEAIIKKPGRLTREEYEIIKNHTIEGFKILDSYDVNENMKYAALMHHERCDGKGYPFQLQDYQINRFAKIVSIADVYDAMTSARCYRGPICPFEVIDIMMDEGLERYDAKLILTFLEHMGNTYLNNRVKLSDESEGEIIFVDSKYPSRPMIKFDNGKLLSLKNTDLRIKEIL